MLTKNKDLLDRAMRAEAEVERLRSDQDAIMAAWDKDAVEHDARIKELEANNKRLEAAFLKSETERKFYTTINGMNSEFDWNGYPECPQNGIHKEWFRQQAREALERIKAGGKDEA